MFLKRLLISLAIVLCFPSFALAQTILEDNTIIEAESVFFTDIKSENFAEVNKPIIFSANPQFDTENYPDIRYNWNFGDGNLDSGKEVAHNFAKPGRYNIKLTVITTDGEFEQNKDIFVAVKAALLLSDAGNEMERVTNFIKNAENSQIYIPLIESFTSESQFLSEDVLARKLAQQEELVSKMELILIWTEGGSGLNALNRYKQATENPNAFNNTSIILITDDLKNLSRVERQFNQLDPKEIIAIDQSARFKLFDNPTITEFKANLLPEEHRIITPEKVKITPFNVLSFFIDFLTEQGIPDNTLVLILLLPIIATIIAFMKQVIGIKTLGIYTPTIITLTFLVLGLKFGVIILFFIIILGTLTHKILKPLKLLYIPKMALILTAVAITVFLLLTLTVYLDLFDIEFISLAIFPVLIMGTLTEKFVSLRSENGLPASLIIMIETFFVSLVAYFITGGAIDLYFTEVQWTFLQELVLNTPEVILLFVIINMYLGRWTGLRLTEYIQFREVFKNIEE